MYLGHTPKQVLNEGLKLYQRIHLRHLNKTLPTLNSFILDIYATLRVRGDELTYWSLTMAKILQTTTLGVLSKYNFFY